MGITAIFVGLLFVPTAVIGLLAGVAIFGHSYQPRKRQGRRGIVPPPPPARGRHLWAIVPLAAFMAMAGCQGPQRPFGLPPGQEDRPLASVRAAHAVWTRSEAADGATVYSRSGAAWRERAWILTCDPDGRPVWVELSPDMVRDLYELGVGWLKADGERKPRDAEP
jgi:hypothetical protein